MPTREQKRWQHYEAAKTLRLARKEIKHNRKPKGGRRREDTSGKLYDLEALDELELPQIERVMPRGERERRRRVAATALSRLEQENNAPDGAAPAEETSGLSGLVVEVSSSLCRVVVDGQDLLCGLRGSLSAQETGFTNIVAVGDRVIVSPDGAGRGSVEAVLPRRSVLARPDVFARHLQQVIVANADQVLIVASWRKPAMWLELIDRYLIAAERHNLSPVICVNKVDLADSMMICRETLAPYIGLGQRVIFSSALTGEGVDKLRDLLRGQTTVLAGLSGVGKSSLLAAIQPGLNLRTGRVSDFGEGRHTTTQVTMLKLDMGGYVVDTPGIREFGVSGLQKSDLARFYPEIADAAGKCRFGNCLHIAEPDCAVRAAVREGRVSEARYHNYTKICADLPA
jgi:ribosome biogenesis GTPase